MTNNKCIVAVGSSNKSYLTKICRCKKAAGRRRVSRNSYSIDVAGRRASFPFLFLRFLPYSTILFYSGDIKPTIEPGKYGFAKRFFLLICFDSIENYNYEKKKRKKKKKKSRQTYVSARVEGPDNPRARSLVVHTVHILE